MWGTLEWWRACGWGFVTIKMVVRPGIWKIQHQRIAQSRSRRTISPMRAMAGSNVGTASLWQSMPSKTNMNFPFPSNMLCNSITNALMLSHLPSPPLTRSSSLCFLNASFVTAIVRSSRCRVVMHSRDLMSTDGVPIAVKTESTTKLLPVASTP